MLSGASAREQQLSPRQCPSEALGAITCSVKAGSTADISAVNKAADSRNANVSEQAKSFSGYCNTGPSVRASKCLKCMQPRASPLPTVHLRAGAVFTVPAAANFQATGPLRGSEHVADLSDRAFELLCASLC